MNEKFWRLAGALVAVILLGLGLGWLGSRGMRPSAPPATSTSPTVARPSAPSGTNQTTFFTRHPRSTTNLAANLAGMTPMPSDVVTNWEDKVDEILTMDKDDSEKAKAMLELFPRLPEDGQVEVAQHLANLVTDADFASLAQYVTNSALPEAVIEVFVSDLLNRPNALKLPALLDIARDEQNPKASEAKDILEVFLENDYGTDWNQWQTKVDQWLKDNPD